MSGSLFSPRTQVPQGRATHDELRQMRADLEGLHYRVFESMALLARFVATDPKRWPQGLAGVVADQLDGGWWSFAWNGTAQAIEAKGAHTVHRVWPGHCMTFIAGMPRGLWHATGGWQDHETRWLRALTNHITAREVATS